MSTNSVKPLSHHGTRGKREQSRRSRSFGTRGNQIPVSQSCSSVPFASSAVRTEIASSYNETFLVTKSDRHLRSIKSNSCKIHVSVFIIPITLVLAANFCLPSVYRSTGQAVFARIFSTSNKLKKEDFFGRKD